MIRFLLQIPEFLLQIPESLLANLANHPFPVLLLT